MRWLWEGEDPNFCGCEVGLHGAFAGLLAEALEAWLAERKIGGEDTHSGTHLPQVQGEGRPG